MRNRKLWAVISLLGGMILIQACDNGLTGIEDDVFLVGRVQDGQKHLVIVAPIRAT